MEHFQFRATLVCLLVAAAVVPACDSRDEPRPDPLEVLARESDPRSADMYCCDYFESAIDSTHYFTSCDATTCEESITMVTASNSSASRLNKMIKACNAVPSCEAEE